MAMVSETAAPLQGTYSNIPTAKMFQPDMWEYEAISAYLANDPQRATAAALIALSQRTGEVKEAIDSLPISDLDEVWSTTEPSTIPIAAGEVH